jgi:hypothetical protein
MNVSRNLNADWQDFKTRSSFLNVAARILIVWIETMHESHSQGATAPYVASTLSP